MYFFHGMSYGETESKFPTFPTYFFVMVAMLTTHRLQEFQSGIVGVGPRHKQIYRWKKKENVKNIENIEKENVTS